MSAGAAGAATDLQVPREASYRPESERVRRAASFGCVAQEYERGRPGYPRAAIEWLLGPRPLRVLDLGAGTGKLTAAAAAAGHAVTAVEPLAQMRQVLARQLPGALVLAGSAEALPLEDASVDAVLVGSAFHWFDQETALGEIVRVLRAGGILGLLGNSFDVSTPWVAELREILGPPAIQRPGHWPPQARMEELFADVQTREFPQLQPIDLERLRDLAVSRSTLAVMAPERREETLVRLEELWRGNPELADSHETTLPWLTRVMRCWRLLADARGGGGGGRPLPPAGGPRLESVPAARVRPLRALVLRPHQAPEELLYAGDDARDTLHVAAALDDEIVGVASVMRQACPAMPGPEDWRIRGMAVLPEWRGRGLGTLLLGRCEAHARTHGARLLWCNARVGARGLYERAGMHVVGAPFVIEPIGEHLLMLKHLAGAPR